MIGISNLVTQHWQGKRNVLVPIACSYYEFAKAGTKKYFYHGAYGHE